MLRWLIFLFVCLPNQVYSKADFILNKQVIDAYSKYTDLDFLGLDSAIIEINSINSGNRFAEFLTGLRNTLTLIIDEDEKFYRVSLSNREKLFNRIEEVRFNSPYKYWCLAELYTYWALVRLKYHEEVRAALDLKKAFKYSSICASEFPWFIPQQKTRAVLEAIASAVPENYTWLASLAGIKGKPVNSINLLTGFIENPIIGKYYSFLIPEAQSLKAFLNYNVLGKNTTISGRNQQNTGMLLLSEIWFHSKNHEPDKVIALTHLLQKQITGLEFCYLKYLIGEARLNSIQNPVPDLKSFITCNSGAAFRLAALRKIGWYYLISGNETEYLKWMHLITLTGKPDTEEDLQALNEASAKTVPEKKLILSRIFFDGGNFQESMKIASEFNALTTLQKIEKDYRIARCLTELNKHDDAIYLYKKIVSSNNTDQYFNSASSYQICLYYAEKGEKDSVLCYLDKIHKSGSETYKKSLSLKARALLNSMPNN